MVDQKPPEIEFEWYGDTIKQKIESALVCDRLNNILQRFGQNMTTLETDTLRQCMQAQIVKKEISSDELPQN